MMTDADKKHLIFSDLDGTLLDHETYQFDGAAKALKQIDAQGIPLILNTSKTLAEVLEIRKKLQNKDPFIAENGSIVAVPQHYFPFELEKAYEPTDMQAGLVVNRLGGNRENILKIIHTIRQEHGFSFTGFDDLGVQELSQLTNLPKPQADLARQRLSTEPVLWQDSDENLKNFLALIADHNLQAVQGGRFLSISRPFDKKDGVAALLSLYKKQHQASSFNIGLGDSPNDEGMLEMMDIAVIIHSEKSKQIHLHHPRRVIRTTHPGPDGWQEAMDQILRR